jgi:hypothetical protein
VRLLASHAEDGGQDATTRKMAIGEIVFRGVQKFLYATAT